MSWQRALKGNSLVKASWQHVPSRNRMHSWRDGRLASPQHTGWETTQLWKPWAKPHVVLYAVKDNETGQETWLRVSTSMGSSLTALTLKGTGSLGSACNLTTSPSCTWLFISLSCCLTWKEDHQAWLSYIPALQLLQDPQGPIKFASFFACIQSEIFWKYTQFLLEAGWWYLTWAVWGMTAPTSAEHMLVPCLPSFDHSAPGFKTTAEGLH